MDSQASFAEETTTDVADTATGINTMSFAKHYICERCGMSFAEVCDLDKHMATHAIKDLKCDICEECFSDSYGLMVHMRLHKRKAELKCEYCNATFPKTSLLTRHLQKHTGFMKYRCEKCGKGFLKRTILLNHVQKEVCTRRREEIKCDNCDEIFLTKTSYLQHKKSHAKPRKRKTGGETAWKEIPFSMKKFRCDVCGRNFSQNDKLEEHMNIHARVETHNCPICNKVFMSKSILIQHKHTHDKDI